LCSEPSNLSVNQRLFGPKLVAGATPSPIETAEAFGRLVEACLLKVERLAPIFKIALRSGFKPF
jgi:hypothetical protein